MKNQGARYFVEDGALHVQTFLEWWEHYGRPIYVEIVSSERQEASLWDPVPQADRETLRAQLREMSKRIWHR